MVKLQLEQRFHPHGEETPRSAPVCTDPLMARGGAPIPFLLPKSTPLVP